MSEETARKLQEAQAEVVRLQAQVDELKRNTLADVAAGIPGRVDELAKNVAQNQPEVTKKLGGDGVKALRADLATTADALAAEVRGASESIEWPKKRHVLARDVHSSLFSFMYGRRVNALAEVLKRHGFRINDSQILPQSLYRDEQFEALAAALGPLSDAVAAVDKAKAADDRDTVDGLWGS